MESSEIEKEVNEFADDYSEILSLRANIVAINTMLIKRGRGEELFKTIKGVIDKYRKNHPIKVDNKDDSK